MTAPTLSADSPYAARLAIDYPEKLDRFTTFFRLIWVIPIALVLGAITASGNLARAPIRRHAVRRSSAGHSGASTEKPRSRTMASISVFSASTSPSMRPSPSARA